MSDIYTYSIWMAHTFIFFNMDVRHSNFWNVDVTHSDLGRYWARTFIIDEYGCHTFKLVRMCLTTLQEPVQLQA